MRSLSAGTAAALTLLASACSQRTDSSATINDDFKKDLAAASVGSSALATSPTNYERLRFVSSIEMSRATEKAPRPKKAVHHDQMAPERNDGLESNTAAAEEVTTVAVETPAPATSTAPVPDPAETMIEEPGTRVGGPSDAPAVIHRPAQDRPGRSIGSVLGAIFGNVVIRGGVADDDKCDPRTARRGRGSGSFAMPMMPMGGMGSGRASHYVYR